MLDQKEFVAEDNKERKGTTPLPQPQHKDSAVPDAFFFSLHVSDLRPLVESNHAVMCDRLSVLWHGPAVVKRTTCGPGIH